MTPASALRKTADTLIVTLIVALRVLTVISGIATLFLLLASGVTLGAALFISVAVAVALGVLAHITAVLY